MPSPFPGMDPYIEDFTWPEFHMRLAVEISNFLILKLPPELTVDIEVTSVVESLLVPVRTYRPDVAVKGTDDFTTGGYVSDTDTLTRVAITPPTLELQWRTEVETKQRTVLIRSVTGGDLVAAIEILSPANKRGEGLQQYRQKRRDYEAAGVHLLEIDLLREGTRPVTVAKAGEATYQIQVSNANRGTLSLWSLLLSTPLPTVGLPLLPEMPDLPISLGQLFAKIYTDAGYGKRLNYGSPLLPVPRLPADAEFLRTLGLPKSTAP